MCPIEHPLKVGKIFLRIIIMFTHTNSRHLRTLPTLVKIFEVSNSCFTNSLSYLHRASSDLWLVCLHTIFSGKPALKRVVAPVARRLWFVFISLHSSSNISFIIVASLVLQIQTMVLQVMKALSP